MCACGIDNGELIEPEGREFSLSFLHVFFTGYRTPMLILILMPSLLLYSLLVTRFIKKTLNFFFGFLFFFPVPSASSLTLLLPTLVPSFSPKDIDLSLIHIKETRSSFSDFFLLHYF